MIVIRAPFRLPLAGGGTDLEFYYKKKGGKLISGSFNQYIYIMLSKRPLDRKILVQTTDTQFSNSLKKVKHDLIRVALEHFKIKDSYQVGTFSTLPTRSGLGSSSTLMVGLLKGLSFMKKISLTKNKLASLAFKLERKKLKLEGGWQDQIISSFGGVQKIDINKKGKFKVRKLNIKNENLRKVEKSFFLVFTEEVRNSSMIVKKQKKNKKVINNYDVIKSKVTAFERFFKRGDTKKIGLLFHSHWIEKQKIAKEITNNNFNQIYKKMILSNLFYGGKIIGAGGGGFFLMVSKNPNKAEKFLKKNKLRYTKPKFDFDGTKIIFK